MKKIIFVFIMAFATITLMAQQTDELTEALDSLVITDIDYGFVRAKFNYGYDSNKRLNQVVFSKMEEYSTDLHYYEKQNYTYDDYGRCLSYTHFIWENGWIVDRKTDSTFNAMGECVFLRNYSYSSYFSNYEKREYTYENGNCTERRIYDAHSADTLWEPYNRLTWEYDDLGNCLQQIDYLPDGNEWNFSTKRVHTYDDRHNLVLSQIYHWDDNTQQWILNESYTSYEYNADNLLLRKYYYQPNRTQETKYTYNEHNQVAVYYDCIANPNFIQSIDTIIYTYDNQDSLITKYEWFLNHTNFSDEIYIYLHEYERDEQGRVVLETAYHNVFFGNNTELWYQNECIYDEQGRVITKHLIDYSTGLNSKVDYVFDDDGNLIHESELYDQSPYWHNFFFDQTFDYSTPSENILGLDRAWNDFIRFMTNHESLMLEIGDPYYYWKNDHFPIHHKWESGTWRFSDPDLPDIIWIVNADVALYYSKHYESLPETPATNNARVYNIENGLAVESDEPADIVVYDMLGRAVAQKRQTLHGEFNLKAGLYVVKVSETAIKAVVK